MQQVFSKMNLIFSEFKDKKYSILYNYQIIKNKYHESKNFRANDA